MTDFSVIVTIDEISGVQRYGNFEKKTLVGHTDDKYYSDYVFTLSGKNIEIADMFRKGDVVKVHFNVACRQSGKDASMWFTNLSAWRIEAVDMGEPETSTDSKAKPVLSGADYSEEPDDGPVPF